MRRVPVLNVDLRAVVEQTLGERARRSVPCFGTLLDLQLAMVEYPLIVGSAEELAWHVAETNALRRIRPDAPAAARTRLLSETRSRAAQELRGWNNPTSDLVPSALEERRTSSSPTDLLGKREGKSIDRLSDDEWEEFAIRALWQSCSDGTRGVPTVTPASVCVRHRDMLHKEAGVDADTVVHDLLTRFCGAFLGHGAGWALPTRNEGFYCAFLGIYRAPGWWPSRWMHGLARELDRLDRERVGPIESIYESLDALGVPEDEWKDFLSACASAFPPPSGTVRMNGLCVGELAPPVSLVEFLAVRLLLDRFSLAETARVALGFRGPLRELRSQSRARVKMCPPPNVRQRAFHVFQLAQLFGLSAYDLHRLSPKDWGVVVGEIESFSAPKRDLIITLACQRRSCIQVLDSFALHASKGIGRPRAPQFQVVCCSDEREEPFRRHLEGMVSSAETFGAAGSFGLAMFYRGWADDCFVPLCPLMARPKHWVIEVGDDGPRRKAAGWKPTRKPNGKVLAESQVDGRAFAPGVDRPPAFGPRELRPLAAGAFSSRLASKIRREWRRIRRHFQATRLRLERTNRSPGPRDDQVGFTIDEMTEAAERLLRDIGLTTRFARLVILLAHGVRGPDNRRPSAGGCDACGGSSGAPNARVMATILNDTRVRTALAGKGLMVPAGTVFVGAFHDTGAGSAVFFDSGVVQQTHRQEFETARDAIATACLRGVHAASLQPKLEDSRNAITIVGRREWTRALALDGRVALASYDPTGDEVRATILTRVLQTILPVRVGADIDEDPSNSTDLGIRSVTWLPYDSAALARLNRGAAIGLGTDFRRQFVEPDPHARLLFIVETAREIILQVIEENDDIKMLCRAGLVTFAALHPESGELTVLEDGIFHRYLPQNPRPDPG